MDEPKGDDSHPATKEQPQPTVSTPPEMSQVQIQPTATAT